MSKKFRKMFGITMGLCRAELYMPTHVFNTANVIGKGHNDIVFTIKNGKITGYFSEEVIKYIGQHGLEVLKSPKFVESNVKEVKEKGDALVEFSSEIEDLPLKHLSSEELLEHYHSLFIKIQEMFGYFNVSQPCISFSLEEEIARQLEDLGLDGDTQYKIIGIMLQPEETTLIEEEEKDLIKLAIKGKKHVDLHHAKYSYLASSEDFDEFHKGYFRKRLEEFSKLPECEIFHKLIEKIPNKKHLCKEREKIITEHNLPSELVHLLDVARIYSHQRMLVRIYWTKGVNVWGKLLREFARRMDISEKQIQYVLKQEIHDYFTKNIPLDMDKVKERQQGAVYAIFDKGESQVHTGEEARKFEEQYLPKSTENLDSVKGMIASKGLKQGKVKVLAYGKNMVKQIEEMEYGDILVTGNTRPDMILALKKASAVVTDEGGIMSHAALVSREFGIPCIVGTKDATQIFNDGDVIEVNANIGIARRI